VIGCNDAKWPRHACNRLKLDFEQQTSNPPTPKASAWQALTCLAVGRHGDRRRKAQR
jgi:hypothetical protein